MKPKLLLHVCCAPCSTECVNRLKENYEVVLYYFNPNIWPIEEFEKRGWELEKVRKKFGVDVVIGDYDHSSWREAVEEVESYAKMSEKSLRCEKCFEYRLKKTASYALANGFDLISTSLTIAPFKDSAQVFKVGKSLDVEFLFEDFKKKDGYRKSIECSRKLGLYRQKYCGCEFSKRNQNKKNIASPKE